MSKPILFSVIFFLMLGLHFNSYASESISTSSTSNDHPIAIGFNCDTLIKKADVDSLNELIRINKRYKNFKLKVYGLTITEAIIIPPWFMSLAYQSPMFFFFSIVGIILFIAMLLNSDKFLTKLNQSKLGTTKKKKFKKSSNIMFLLSFLVLIIIFFTMGALQLSA